VDAQVLERRVESDDTAQRERFLGSPTLRIDGVDIDPGAAQRQDYGLNCRLYSTPAGLRGAPPDDCVLDASVLEARSDVLVDDDAAPAAVVDRYSVIRDVPMCRSERPTRLDRWRSGRCRRRSSGSGVPSCRTRFGRTRSLRSSRCDTLALEP
jgi:hypothetical protein